MFKVGDEVIIVNGTTYGITREGSVGTILWLDSHTAEIEFHLITSDNQTYVGDTFPIEIKHIKLLNRKTNTEIVIDKIREMNNRFNTRKQHESVFF